jgi:hypothetical protein
MRDDQLPPREIRTKIATAVQRSVEEEGYTFDGCHAFAHVGAAVATAVIGRTYDVRAGKLVVATDAHRYFDAPQPSPKNLSIEEWKRAGSPKALWHQVNWREEEWPFTPHAWIDRHTENGRVEVVDLTSNVYPAWSARTGTPSGLGLATVPKFLWTWHDRFPTYAALRFDDAAQQAFDLLRRDEADKLERAVRNALRLVDATVMS